MQHESIVKQFVSAMFPDNRKITAVKAPATEYLPIDRVDEIMKVI